MLYRIFFSILLVSFVGNQALSQSFYQYKRDLPLSAVGGFGLSGYYGDLNNPGDIIDINGSFMIGGDYAINDMFSARAQLSYIRVTGKDSDIDEDIGTRNRNLSFKSNLVEFAALGVYRFTNRGSSFYLRPKFNAYAMTGLAVTYSNPKAEFQGETYNLRPIQTEGKKYSSVIMALPFGVGATYSVTNWINVGMEGTYRWTFTDYIDDVSSRYIDNSLFTDPVEAILADRRQELGLQPAEAGAIRGNPDKNDGYFTLNLVVQYYIPKRPYTRPGGVKRNKQQRQRPPKRRKKR